MLQRLKSTIKSNTRVDVSKNIFIRFMFAQMAMALVSTVNTTIDGIVAGQFLTELEISVIRLQSVVDLFVAVVYLVTEGSRILLCEYMGKGKRKELSTIISTATILVVSICGTLTLIFNVFAIPVSRMLGATEAAIQPCAEYVSACAWGIIPRILTNLFYSLCLLYSISRINHIAAASGILTNAVLDVLLAGVLKLGVRGLGLASSASYIISLLILLVAYLIRIRPKQERGRIWDGSLIPEIVKNGIPIFSLLFGIFIGTYLVNMVISTQSGTSAIAAATVQRFFFTIGTIIFAGCGNAYIIVANVLYTMQDREAFTGLTKGALRISLILSTILTLLTVIFRQQVTEIFFKPSGEAWTITMSMLLIVPFQAVFYCIYMIFYKMYQIEKRYKFVNFLALIENPGIALCALILGRIFGLKGIWVAHVLMDVICLFIIWVYAGYVNKKPCRSLNEMFLLDKNFGENKIGFSRNITAPDMVQDVSEEVRVFLKKHGYSNRISLQTSLCIEEMAGNIVEHGFDNKNNMIDINMTCMERRISIFIRDNCVLFDPTQRSASLNEEDPYENIGIRMISNMADEMRYIDALGVNTLIINLDDI